MAMPDHPATLMTFLFSVSLSVAAQAQTTSILTEGLHHPTKVINAGAASLLVAEAGTMEPNTGRISLVNRDTGSSRTLVDGLPSGVSNLGGPPETDGVTGLFLLKNTLYVSIGVGDAAINVGPGLELPNPAGASSPLFNSVLKIDLQPGFQRRQGDFSLTLAQQARLARHQDVFLFNEHGYTARVRLLADLPDYRAEPQPEHPDNVRAAHLFGLEAYQGSLYVIDAAFNMLYRIGLKDGQASTWVNLDNLANPMFPDLGGPFVEPVPDNIHRLDGQLLVSLLTGFPFVPGRAEIQAINLANGEVSTLIPNLTSAIDVMHVNAGNDDYFLTLEFSTNQLLGEPGRMMYFGAADSAGIPIVPVLISPTSMVRDNQTGDIYVTNIFPGTLTRVTFP